MKENHMTSRDFAFWLQGFFEITGDNPSLSPKQTEIIQRHLALVFKHEIDLSAGSAAHQAELNKIHAPTTPVGNPASIGVTTKPSYLGSAGGIGGIGPNGEVLRC